MSTEPIANILIVDDDRKTLLGMEELLAGPGRQIVTAASGQEALRRLLRMNFALILLDVRMPDMDGFETADLIRHCIALWFVEHDSGQSRGIDDLSGHDTRHHDPLE